MILWLALLFALVALAYASVGFGGGSSYNALLALSGIEYALLPVIALLCNIIIVTDQGRKISTLARVKCSD